MEKRYQVFISSTFLDLQEERQAAMRAVLELGYMPAGMELFPADDDDSWELIKEVIDSSDYYVVIVGGRYGSMDAEGVGYTEREYEYATSQRIPVIALLHAKPDELPRGRTETDETAWESLESFRAKLEKNHNRKTWDSAERLHSALATSLTTSTRRHPREGWVRASEVPSKADLREVMVLQSEIRELEAQLERERTHAPEGTAGLSQGEADFRFSIECVTKDKGYRYNISLWTRATWHSIFAAIAPSLIHEAVDAAVRKAIDDALVIWGFSTDSIDKQVKGKNVVSAEADASDVETCLVQFRALGLIMISERKRSVSNTGTYWTLTPYGDHLMTRLRALKSGEQDEETDEAE